MKDNIRGSMVRLARAISQSLPLEEGKRHIRTCLAWHVQRGLPKDEAESICSDALKLWDRVNASRVLSQQEVKEWCFDTQGYFELRHLYQDLALTDKTAKARARTALNRLVGQGVLEKHENKPGTYRRIQRDTSELKWWEADISTTLPLKWPLGLEDRAVFFPKSVIVVAGQSNAGKTAFCIESALLNCNFLPVHYFTSEMGAEETKERLMLHEEDEVIWKDLIENERFVVKERADNFPDVIVPDAFNVIDYLELNDEFFRMRGIITAVFNKLSTGVALIALQTPGDSEFGLGGRGTIEKARMALTLVSVGAGEGECIIKKIKKPKDPSCNFTNQRIPYRIMGGAGFVEKVL